MASIDDRCARLCSLVKLWAKAHGLHDASCAMLNLLSLRLMVIFYLQVRPCCCEDPHGWKAELVPQVVPHPHMHIDTNTHPLQTLLQHAHCYSSRSLPYSHPSGPFSTPASLMTAAQGCPSKLLSLVTLSWRALLQMHAIKHSCSCSKGMLGAGRAAMERRWRSFLLASSASMQVSLLLLTFVCIVVMALMHVGMQVILAAAPG